MASKLKIKVNGLVHSVTASLDTPLLYVLHNELHLHGPRFGCGLAQCGACSVLLDGKEIRSCVTPVAAVSGKAITTLEGLPAMWSSSRGTTAAAPAALHPLQQAWIDVQVPHCGYCQNGMMIQAADLLATTKRPTEAQIRTAMNGHLCRCGTYPRILTAIEGRQLAMTELLEKEFSRKAFVKGGGALIVGFSLAGAGLVGKAHAAESPYASNGPYDAGLIDTWIRIHSDNTASIMTGHEELGQGSATGMLQIAGEELDMDFRQLTFVNHDTNVQPNSPPSYASNGISKNGQQVRAAAAAAKQALLGLAATQLSVAAANLTVKSGVVSGGGKTVTYGELIGDKLFNVRIPASYNLNQSNVAVFSGSATSGVVSGAPGTKPVSQYTLVGTRVPRIDIPDKVTGTFVFSHNVRVPGMLHGRIVWPRGQRSMGAGAPIVSVDASSIKHIPSVQIVRRGDFLAVVSPKEYDAIQAAAQLKVTWADPPPLSGNGNFAKQIREQDSAGQVVARDAINTGNMNAALASAAHVVSGTYAFPYNGHMPIGPACAVADVTPQGAVIYTNSQDLWGLRTKLAQAIGLRENVIRLRYFEGSSNYGDSFGRYETPISAAVMSQIVGKPVRLQAMRWDEHGYDNYGQPQLMDIRAGIDANGKIVAFEHTNLSLAANGSTYTVQRLLGIPGPNPGATSPPWAVAGAQYAVPNWRVTGKTLPQLNGGYFKTSKLRAPESTQAAFGAEQVIDELARAANMDPIAFRRLNIQTANTHSQANFLWTGRYDYSSVASNKDRWLTVLNAVAEASNWQPKVSGSKLSSATVVTGRGVGLGGHGNGAAQLCYACAVADIEVNKKTGKIVVTRLYTGMDYGLIVGPDLVMNQGVGQSMMAVSKVLHEEVRFDTKAVTSLDWVTYPILRFKDHPTYKHVIINRPDITPGPSSEELMPPIVAAIANAFFDATGVRIRQAPLTPARVRAVLKAAGVA
jgi:CO/xanthine dehydrogenase Mo-binding subunit/aerobic-type carbon monoxide dehydrogenase small subunit (CoxS/CutS family)